MKDRSRAVAMMVLHMSSHIVSGGGDFTHERSRYLFQCLFFCFFLPNVDYFFGKLTLYNFPLAEALLSVAVADSVASLNPHPQASLVAPDDLISFRDMTKVSTESNVVTSLRNFKKKNSNSWVGGGRGFPYLCSLGGIWTDVCSPRRHRNYLDMSAGRASRWSSLWTPLQ